MNRNSSLLNEVIADAKAVKETAYQTAIGALKEAFEPQVRNMISQKLAEEGELDDEEVPATEPEMEAPVATPAPEAPAEDDFSFETEAPAEEDDVDLEEILRELDNEEEPLAEEDEFGLEEGEEEEAPAPEPAPEEDIDGTLDELIREMEGELEDDENVNEENEYMDNEAPTEKVVESLKRKLKESDKNLKEAYSAIRKQKAVINEVNLLNSKLLFMTRINSKHKLTESGKLKVLEAFDRANTIREVKLVYATISENFNKPVATPVNKTTTRRRGINESASRPERTINPAAKQHDFVPRFKVLAGIK